VMPAGDEAFRLPDATVDAPLEMTLFPRTPEGVGALAEGIWDTRAASPLPETVV